MAEAAKWCTKEPFLSPDQKCALTPEAAWNDRSPACSSLRIPSSAALPNVQNFSKSMDPLPFPSAILRRLRYLRTPPLTQKGNRRRYKYVPLLLLSLSHPVPNPPPSLLRIRFAGSEGGGVFSSMPFSLCVLPRSVCVAKAAIIHAHGVSADRGGGQ